MLIGYYKNRDSDKGPSLKIQSGVPLIKTKFDLYNSGLVQMSRYDRDFSYTDELNLDSFRNDFNVFKIYGDMPVNRKK